jgi:hypothetical protein
MKNANWAVRMEHLAGTKPGQYFFFSIGTGSLLAQTETFSQPQQGPEGNDYRKHTGSDGTALRERS